MSTYTDTPTDAVPPVKGLGLDLTKYEPVESIVPNYVIPHLHHEYPVPSMKDIVLATTSPHLKAMRDFLRDEALYMRRSVDIQNQLIGSMQVTLTSMVEQLLHQVDRMKDTNIEVGEMQASKADTTEYQVLTIDYNARMDLYQQQIRDFSVILSMTVSFMREISSELSKVGDGLVSMNHSYILGNPEVPEDVKQSYTQLISSLEILEERASTYANTLPVTPY